MLFYGLLLVQGVKRGWGWKVWQIAKLLMMKFGYQLFNWILLVFFLSAGIAPIYAEIWLLGSEAGPGLGSVAWGYSAFGIRHPSHTPR